MTAVPLKITSPADEQPNKPRWQSGKDVKPVETRWILPRRLTVGSLAIVEGDTDTGKSVFLAHLAAAITSGKPFLGRPKSPPKGVLWMTAEEDMGESIGPRIEAAGGDLARWFVPELDEHNQRQRFTFPDAVGVLRQAIADLDLALIVIEPLASHVSSDTDLNSTAGCRAALDPLNLLALSTGCTIVVTRGFRKSRLGARTAWGEGNNTIGATARVILQVEKIDGEENGRTLRTIKCKGTRSTPLLRYSLDFTKGAPRMVDIRDVGSEDDLDDVGSADPGERDAKVEAVDLLRSVIGDDWIPVRKIIDAGAEAGLLMGVLRKAKAKLRVRHRRVGFGPESVPQWGPPEGGWSAPMGGGARERAPMQSMEKPVKKRRAKRIDT